jgi:hypothetical protein
MKSFEELNVNLNNELKDESIEKQQLNSSFEDNDDKISTASQSNQRSLLNTSNCLNDIHLKEKSEQLRKNSDPLNKPIIFSCKKLFPIKNMQHNSDQSAFEEQKESKKAKCNSKSDSSDSSLDSNFSFKIEGEDQQILHFSTKPLAAEKNNSKRKSKFFTQKNKDLIQQPQVFTPQAITEPFFNTLILKLYELLDDSEIYKINHQQMEEVTQNVILETAKKYPKVNLELAMNIILERDYLEIIRQQNKIQSINKLKL